MRRRTVQTISALIAIPALAVVLYNATLVDRRPPTLERVRLSASLEGEDRSGQTLTAIDLEFSEPVDRSSVERRFRIEPYVAGTFSWDRDTVAIFTPSKKLPPATAFTISLEAGYTDLAGNAAQKGLDGWAFQTVGPPVVASVTPPDGSIGVPVNAQVVLTFDRLMDTGSVGSQLSVDPAIPFHQSWSGRKLTIVFDRPLGFGTRYSVQIGTGAADTDGSSLSVPSVTTFSTVAAGLGIRSVVPSGGVSGISIRSPIAVLFDAPIDPATASGAIRISPAVAGSTSVVDLPTEAVEPAATASPSPAPSVGGPGSAGQVLLFTPTAPLAPHTTYTVTLDPVVARLDDPAEVAAGLTWAFTTGGPTTTIQNQIAFLSARDGIRNLWLMNPDGSNPRQLTTELVGVTAYDISADGRTIVYAAGGAVRSMSADGTGLVTLTARGVFEYAPVLTPDGNGVLVARRGADGRDLGYVVVPLPGADGSERQVLKDGAPPLGSLGLGPDGLPPGPGTSTWARRSVFDPTGRYLLIVDGTGRPRLVDLGAAPAAGTLELPLEPPLSSNGAPVRAPAAGAGFIVAGRGPGDSSSGLWRVPLTGETSRLGDGTGSVAVAGSGRTVTLVGGDGAARLALAASPGATLAVLTTAPDLVDRSPGFAPDGSTIVFVRVPAAAPEHSSGIWLVGPDGRELRQVSTDGTDPFWLP